MGKRQKDELPDYTVANMDVDGMPWNTGRKKFSVQDQELDTEEKEPLTKAETKAVIWLSLKAGLVIGGVFIGAAAPVSYTHLDVYKRQVRCYCYTE